MGLTLSQWHERYIQQARWTKSLRAYIIDKCGIQQASKILDVGCGTGVVEHEITTLTGRPTYGLDIDPATINFAKTYAPDSIYSIGNGRCLPYGSATFDVTFCHFFLLWVSPARQVVDEMARVTKPGGFVIAMAEPDYGGRIDYPDELTQLGNWQAEALEKQGASPLMGRQLRAIFSAIGFDEVESGILGAQWGKESTLQDMALEWQVLSSDLEDNPEFIRKADEFKELEIASLREKSRILFVPVFYGIGRVRG